MSLEESQRILLSFDLVRRVLNKLARVTKSLELDHRQVRKNLEKSWTSVQQF